MVWLKDKQDWLEVKQEKNVFINEPPRNYKSSSLSVTQQFPTVHIVLLHIRKSSLQFKLRENFHRHQTHLQRAVTFQWYLLHHLPSFLKLFILIASPLSWQISLWIKSSIREGTSCNLSLVLEARLVPLHSELKEAPFSIYWWLKNAPFLDSKAPNYCLFPISLCVWGLTVTKQRLLILSVLLLAFPRQIFQR